MKNIFIIIICIFGAINLFSQGIDGVSPYGGEQLMNQTGRFIQWDYYDSTDYVNIYVWDGNMCDYTLAGSNIAASQSSYSWTINQSGVGDMFRVKIQSVNHPEIVGFSEGYFTINPYQEGQSLSVREDNNSGITVFPNPANSFIEIKSETTPIIEIIVWNSYGKFIQKFKCNGDSNQRINTDAFDNGIYYCIINTGTKKITKKFIVVK